VVDTAVATNDTAFTVGFVSFLLASVWVLIVSVMLFRRPSEAA
jgi:hypothetical protein